MTRRSLPPPCTTVPIVALSLLLSLVLHPPAVARADSLSLSGRLDTSDPQFDSPGGLSGDHNCTALTGLGPTFYYDAEPFSVDAGGVYTLDMSSPAYQPYLVLYEYSFDPASPQTNCVQTSTSGGAAISVPLVAGRPYFLVLTSYLQWQTGDYTAGINGPGNIVNGHGEPQTSPPPTGRSAPAPSGHFPGYRDGRINAFEVYTPAAIYPVDYGTGTGLHIYRINAAGHGWLALAVSPEQIAAVPEHPVEHTLIAASDDGFVQLYRLTNGALQVNAGPDAGGLVVVTIFDCLQPGCGPYETYSFSVGQ